MSYAAFLVIFVCLPLAGLIYHMRHSLRRSHLLMLLGLAAIAVIYTTPWDNYLVATRVWYYDPRLVLNITLWYVPIEEYTFFVLQTFLTGLFAIWCWRQFYPADFKQKSGITEYEEPQPKLKRRPHKVEGR
jgi:lycopene cyclase domain-containing protein